MLTVTRIITMGKKETTQLKVALCCGVLSVVKVEHYVYYNVYYKYCYYKQLLLVGYRCLTYSSLAS